ncbi:MAG: hypothetical protein WD009_03250 [Phycisphaeraceae bacterium]
MASQRRINRRYATDRLRVDQAHVGLLDVETLTPWIARRRLGTVPLRVSHARLLAGGTQSTSTAEKDRFLCYWFHTPNTGEGYVHGYPIEWDEGHMLIRLDPNWDHRNATFIPGTDTARVEANIDRQFDWARLLFEMYVEKGPRFPLSWHMIGPRAADSMFYVKRVEAQ